ARRKFRVPEILSAELLVFQDVLDRMEHGRLPCVILANEAPELGQGELSVAVGAEILDPDMGEAHGKLLVSGLLAASKRYVSGSRLQPYHRCQGEIQPTKRGERRSGTDDAHAFRPAGANSWPTRR